MGEFIQVLDAMLSLLGHWNANGDIPRVLCTANNIFPPTFFLATKASCSSALSSSNLKVSELGPCSILRPRLPPTTELPSIPAAVAVADVAPFTSTPLAGDPAAAAVAIAEAIASKALGDSAAVVSAASDAVAACEAARSCCSAFRAAT